METANIDTANLTLAQLQELLGMMLVANNQNIKEATRVLKAYFKHPVALDGLFQTLTGQTDNPNLRLIACVYMRKIIGNLWIKVDKSVQQNVKTALLTAFVNEPVTVVKKNVAEVIGALSKLLIPNKEWDELTQFVLEYTQGANATLVQKEHAMLLLSVIIEYQTNKVAIENFVKVIVDFLM